MYDLIVRNGRVIDGTGAPWFRADVAVQDGRILGVGRFADAAAAVAIDADDRFVAPGFIDIHTHSDLTLLIDGRASSTLAQGVTTQVVGNCGVSAAPVRHGQPYYGPLDPAMTRGLVCDWEDYAGYFQRLESQGIGTNVAALVGHGNLRVAAMGYDDRTPTPAEMERMRQLAARAMEDGALGLSSGLAYAPGPYAAPEEFVELGRVVGRYGGLYTSHIRNQTEGIAAAVGEVIAVGEAAGIAAHVSHMQPGSPMIGATRELLATLEQARRRGVDVSCDAIPYTIGSTTLKSLLPPWACDGGDEALLRRLRDPAARGRIKADTMAHGAESGGSRKRNLAKEGRWDRIWLGSAAANAHLVGKSFVEIGRLRGQDPHDAVLDLLLEEEARPWMLAEDVSEEDFRNIASHPVGGVISDGFSLRPEGVLGEGKHHPRSYGAFPYFLRRFVREQGALAWEAAVHKLTGYGAARFRLPGRGLVREGAAADLVVFDPGTVAEAADFDRPYQYPVGIDWVVVNGRLAVDRGQLQDTRSGQVLRRAA
ncbi:MAG: D-aminoacylase [Gemmatimonadota bacterium]